MPCKDGHVVMLAPQQHQWDGFVKYLGDKKLAADERCENENTRADHASEINPIIEEHLKDRNREEIYHGAQASNCPMGSVYSSGEVMDNEQAKARGFFQEVDHPLTGGLRHPVAPYQYSETPWRSYRHAPLLGQHNCEVYCEGLGYSAEQLEELTKEGII